MQFFLKIIQPKVRGKAGEWLKKIEQPSTNHEALSSNPSAIKKKKKFTSLEELGEA
jgi:hypothetical protein